MTLDAAAAAVAARTPTVIHIQGRATIERPAERSAVEVHVSDTGFDKDLITKNVVTAVNTIKNEVDQLSPRLENGDISPDAPVTFYSIASLKIFIDDRYDRDGGRSNDPDKKMYTAESDVDIHFGNFSTLGDTAARLSAMPYVLLRGIDWRLTDAKHARLEEEVREQALRNAIERANAYAKIIGREKVTCVKIEDDGQSGPQHGNLRHRGRGGPNDSASDALSVSVGIELAPRKVQVNGTVRVEFHAE